LGLANGKWGSAAPEVCDGRRAVKDQTQIENNLTHVCLLLLLILQSTLPVDEAQNKARAQSESLLNVACGRWG